MHLTPALLRWSRAHHQLVTRGAWLASGGSDRSFDRAVASGALVRMAPSVALLPGADPDRPETRIAAVVLSSRRQLLASHRSAAYLWGGAVSGVDPIEVLVGDRSSSVRLPGVVVHRPTDVEGLRGIVRRGIPTTDPFRTLVDLGASDPRAVSPFLESLLIDGTVTSAGVRTALSRRRRRGRHGVEALQQALDALVIDDRPPDSVLETRLAALFANHGIDGWVFHLVVAGHELDFAFPGARLDVEVDGWAYHGSRRRYDADRARDAELTTFGWRVLRFSWSQVTRRPGTVVAAVRAALAERG